MIDKEIIAAAAKIGAETAIKKFEEQKQIDQKNRHRLMIKRTRTLLKNYRNLKEHAKNAIYKASDIENDSEVGILALMMSTPNNKYEVTIESIKRSSIRTQVIVTHIEKMMEGYKDICAMSSRADDMRAWRIVYAVYIAEDPKGLDDIAEMENIDKRTIYRDVEVASEVITSLMFGIESMVLNT